MKKAYFSLLLLIIAVCCQSPDEQEIKPQEEAIPTPLTEIPYRKVPKGARIPTTVGSDFIWGINGHPLNQEAYLGNSLDQQIDLVKEHLMTYYRVDVPTDMNGNVPDLLQWNSLLSKALANGIKILPVLYLPGLEANITTNQAFVRGKNQVEQFLNSFGSHFEYFELGNELELGRGPNGLPVIIGGDGDLRTHYDTTNLAIMAAYLKGMTQAVKDYDSTYQTIVDTGGWRHYGFLDLLKDKGVDWDITGYHWYSEMGSLLGDHNGQGNIIEILTSKFGKPVWLTEINKRYGSIGNTEAEQYEVLKNYMSELSALPDVKAFMVYALYEEPAFYDGVPAEDDNGYCGIIDWQIKYTSIKYKPASEAVKLKIEEAKHGYEDYAFAIFEDCNLRSPDSGGLAYWAEQYELIGNQEELLETFLPIESYYRFVEGLYTSLLGHTGAPGGLTYWTEMMQQNGLPREGVISYFCGSAEFWDNAGGSNDGFIEAVFQKILNRSADATALSYWGGRLTGGTSRIDVTYEILHSNEYLHIFVRQQFDALLDRLPDPSGENQWVDQMTNGLDQFGMIKQILLSEEYFNHALIRGYERNYPLYSFHH